MLERYPIAANVVSQLADAGLISDGDTWTPDEVKIIAAVQTMREAGLDEEHGFEVTGLALYVSATESLIDAEIGLFNTRTLREGSGTDYARLAAAAIDGSSRLLGALHRRLLSQRLKGDS